LQVKRKLYGVRGKAVEGYRSPRRWRETRRHTNRAKRLGVRQSSGALGRRAGWPRRSKTKAGRAGRRETISLFRRRAFGWGRDQRRKLNHETQQRLVSQHGYPSDS
jgi:hypothetical protein